MSLQIIINGLSLGSVYALIATGFSLIFNILKFTNFAHGALMILSAFVGYFLAAQSGWGFFLTVLVSVVAGAILAVAGEFIAFRRITLRETSPIYFFVSSITLGVLLQGIVVAWAGANFHNYPRFFANPTFTVGGIILSTSDTIMFGLSAVALVVLGYVIRNTRQGRALRSVSFDRVTAGLMGINVTRTIQFTFLVSGALAGLSGVFLGINYTLFPTLGDMVVKGYVAAVIGGLGSLHGAVIGAILLGLTETMLIRTIGAGYTPVVIFVIMLVFLLLRPRGIAGSNIQEKA